MRSVGLLGGTFDPVHVGHVLLANYVRERLPLDEVILVPAADPPHKQRREDMAPAEHRWAMVCRAVNPMPGLGVSRVELDRIGKSYTVDTLAQLGDEHPDWALHLLIGEDNISQIVSWHDPERILSLCTVVAGTRPGFSQFSGGRFTDRIVRLPTPAFEISSTAVRQRVRCGRSIRYLVPEAVERHIHEHGLYCACS